MAVTLFQNSDYCLKICNLDSTLSIKIYVKIEHVCILYGKSKIGSILI